MRFAGWAARRVLQQAFHIDPTKKSCVQQYWCSNDFSPLQSEFKIYFYPIKHGSPLEHCSEGLPCFIFILLCPVFCRCRAACRKSCAFAPSCLRTGPLAPFAAHGGLRRPLRSAHASALALRGRLRAKSRAFSAVARKGGFAPFRHAPAGAITTPFWRHSPRGLHFAAQRCMALPPPAFSPDASFTSLFMEAFFRLCSPGGFNLLPAPCAHARKTPAAERAAPYLP